MERLRQIFGLLLLLNLSALAQSGLRNPAFVARLNQVFPGGGEAPPYYPTNANSYAWYYGDSISNAPGTQLTNWTDSFGSHPLTNEAAIGRAPMLTNYNNHCVVIFGASGRTNNLGSYSFNLPQPFELWFAMKWDPNTSDIDGLFGNQGLYTYAQYRTSGSLRVNYGTSATVAFQCTNKWMTLRLIGNGTSSVGWTNNVLWTAANMGGNTFSNIYVGCADYFQYPTTVEIGEILAYSATNDPSTANSIFQYFTNKYAIIAP